MPLLTGPQSLSNFVELTGTALQAPSPPVVLQATLALSNLLRYTYVHVYNSTFLVLYLMTLHHWDGRDRRDTQGVILTANKVLE